MTAGQIGLALGLMVLAGCDDRLGDYPQLLPTDQILADPAIPGHASATAQDPAAVTQDLQGRAAALSKSTPAPVATGLRARGPAAPVMEDGSALAQRAEALRKRAAGLAATSLDDCSDPDAAGCTATGASQ